MSRIKRGTTSLRRRHKVLAQTKGYRHARGKKERAAREAIAHAGAHAFAHRRDKKGDFRRMWQVKINAAARAHGLSYSRFMDALKKKQVGLDRKILAHLAEHYPETFSRIVARVE
ncbi:50S ribosomal protein L20 [Candidatus Nomurabacteria bacterium RIFCSPHIGHO2_02_FULL_42_24]|uniref:Large ribosomal subunit protein bL20 n=1 Tax=Candidatus Nomurabacteria bacterium RIFCSPHIGHO2_02_FULL_42_24 TaxID=1801757 RepID=A0A1F6WIL2_9BACT|nr:MAG: 50S ribosomal protein L20 [Candidatus Nomurabacteria bacterium RIFCSPHIGHO2_02_FULL_42_24]